MIVDIHCHLDHPYFEDKLNKVIERSRKADVKIIIAQGVHHESNLKVLEISEKYDIVKAALGLFPLNAKNVSILSAPPDEYDKETKFTVDQTLEFIKKNKNKIIALGEVGLDLKFSHDFKNQKENFEKILELSEKIKKPPIIHSRKAEQHVVDILESFRIKKAVLHFFCGNKKLIRKAADLGLYFSIPTIITKLQHFQMLVEEVNINQLFTETDAPWLSPFPEKKNEPAFIKETIKKIAEVKKLSKLEVENNIFMNYQQLFLK